jgi:hypothetical protein
LICQQHGAAIEHEQLTPRRCMNAFSRPADGLRVQNVPAKKPIDDRRVAHSGGTKQAKRLARREDVTELLESVARHLADRKDPGLIVGRPAIPLVGRVAGEGVGVEETFRLAPDCALGDERPLAWLAGGRLAVSVVEEIAGGALEECHSPQWRRIFSITSACGGLMKAITFISPWRFGQQSGSISYTRLISIAFVWLERLGVATSDASLLAIAPGSSAASASAALRRIPRALFEYQP